MSHFVEDVIEILGTHPDFQFIYVRTMSLLLIQLKSEPGLTLPKLAEKTKVKVSTSSKVEMQE